MIPVKNKSLQDTHQDLEVCFEDPWFLVVAKPSGMATHPGRGVVGESLLELLERQYKTKLFPLHRLDAGTSGVLAFGRSREAAQVGAALFRTSDALNQTRRFPPDEGQPDPVAKTCLKKSYWALVRGHMTGDGSILAPVGTPPKEATTHWKGIRAFEVPWEVRPYMTARYGLVRLEPVTGRTHQLRQHLHHVYHPLIGDTRYGDGVHNRMFRSKMRSHRLMLHCGEIKGNHPFTNDAFCWAAPFPENFKSVINELAKIDLAANTLKN